MSLFNAVKTGSVNISNSFNGGVTIKTNSPNIYTMKLPTTIGSSGQVLTTDGGNPVNLSWETVSGTGGNVFGSEHQYVEYELQPIVTSSAMTIVSLNAVNLSNGMYRIDYSYEIKTDSGKALSVVTVVVNNNIIAEANSTKSSESKESRFLALCGFKEMNLSGDVDIVMNLDNAGDGGDVTIRRCRISLYRIS